MSCGMSQFKGRELIKKNALLAKMACKCGRKLIIKKNYSIHEEKPIQCGVCKLMGLKASKQNYLNLGAAGKYTINDPTIKNLR